VSQIQNVITTTFRARGGQAIASMGTMAQGFGQIGRAINDNTRMSERLNAQWRAIGTTIRYAVAGTAVFGLTRMVDQLKNVQVQLGLISAIGETASGAPLVGRNLNELFNQSRAGAVEAITPITDYNNAVINLLSTIQGVPQDQITPIVTTISQAARLAQVSAEDATKAFTTMNVAFGRTPNLANIRRMAQEFFILTREAPGGAAAGQQVIGQLGQLAAVTRAGRGTPEDMFSLLLTSLRGGIPPSQTGRGLQFLVQTLAFPGQQVADSRRALASVGITSDADLTLQQRLTRIFSRARALGMTGDTNKLNNLDDETLAGLEASPGGTTGALNQLGIGGRGAAFLGTIFRRIHALRTALAIESQIESGDAQTDLLKMQRAAQGHTSDINNMALAWEKFRRQARLQQASVAIESMGLQVAKVFEPVLNFASGLIGGTNAQGRPTGLHGVMQRHQEATRNIAIGGAVFLGALGIARGAGLGRLPGIRRIPVLSTLMGGNIGRGFVMANAAQAAISGNTQIGGSPQNPIYVVVVGQLFGGATAGPLGGGTGPGGAAGRVAEDLLAYKAIQKGGPAAKRALGRLFGAGSDAIAKADITFRSPSLLRSALTRAGLKAIPGAGIALSELVNAPGAGGGEEGYIQRLTRARQLFPGQDITHVQGMPKVKELRGRAEVFLTIDTVGQGGKITRKRVHIPLNMWEHGRAPSRRGTPGTRRSG
jgi:hypothetical protein